VAKKDDPATGIGYGGWIMQVAPEGELWWDPKRPDQGSWIELGEKFFQAITTVPVPTDLGGF
jgi:hypothetical protein